MNERIKELVEHAVTRFDPDMDGEMEPNEIGDWVMVNDVEKFAELIIQECLYGVGHFTDVDEGIAVVKKNLGVEW